ncbi:uncharacterized protein C8A04DRAFT_30365 [Dichotomopilus funicola]|uniref:Uncharacterized protein n=1 Tax=Dichotomopilus funicola TaxID=1934379 RepID=A0AAN6UZ94_9PEZI|nr:hypothetical protein C8A04DRAFT_30365 [Dichotomopilus funicola]
MEDLKREFEADLVKKAPTELKPPTQVSKPLLDQHMADMVETNPPRRTQGKTSPNNDKEQPSATALPTAAYKEVSDGTGLKFYTPQNSMERRLPQPTHQPDIEDYLRQELERSQVQLHEANTRADQAERAARELSRELQLRSRTSAVAEIRGGSSEDAATSLRAENARLKAELDEARSHIFSLQPYRKELTPKEIGQDFDDLVNNVTDWVTDFMDPTLDSDERRDEVLTAAKKRPGDIQKLKGYLRSQPDLVYGCMYPETDVDIFIAVVMRYLQDHIFQKALYGATSDVVETINFLEASMQTNVEPKRDQFALRTWSAEALNALICSPNYQRARHTRKREITTDLSSLFKIFLKEKEWNKFCVTCQDTIIKPAIALHEKLLTSTDHFYLDLVPYVLWGPPPDHNIRISPDFISDLPRIRCENILQNRKPLSVTKLDPSPSLEQLHHELTHVVSVVPGLYMRQVGKGDVIKEPTVVRMQQTLVAWGAADVREKFVEGGEGTLVRRLCFSRKERGDDQGGGGGLWEKWRNLQLG